MKKSTIVALCFIGVGLILLFASHKTHKNNVSSLNTDSSYTEMQYECKENISEINLEETSNRIEVKVGNVDKPIINYYVKEGILEYDISEKNGSLDFKRNEEFNFSISFGINFFEPTVTLTLPKSYNEDLNIKVSSGSVEIDDAKLDDLSVRCSSGSIKLNNLSTKDLEINSSSGSIKLSDIESSESIICKYTSGSVKFENVNASSGIAISGTSGTISLTNISSKETSLYCSSGSIHFENLNADNIILKSTSGSIKGSIDGKESEYSIISDVTSGSCNLTDKREGSKNLDAKTTSGSIKITFND